jgi:hypothetical protein
MVIGGVTGRLLTKRRCVQRIALLYQPLCNASPITKAKEYQMNTITRMLGACAVALSLSACAPEVGSPEWCADLKEKPKGDWTANEAVEFTKNCLL